MKRYLLFAGEEFHAAGGYNDFVRDGDNPEELQKLGHRMVEEHQMELDWYQVVDTKENKFLFCDEEHVHVVDDVPHMIDWARRRGYIE